MKFFKKLIAVAKSTSPGFRKRFIALFLFLFLLHLFILVASFIFVQQFSVLIGLLILAYGLGLRHAVDADHIAAIDNTTRKLMQEKQRPVGVGLFFSLGHSTVVILLSLLVALSAEFIKKDLPAIEKFGSLFGSSVSSFFLLLIGFINLLTLLSLISKWIQTKKGKKFLSDKVDTHIHAKGIMMKILQPLTKTIGKTTDMYIVGLLFGLGFDTATEVALLSISVSSTSALPFFVILLLPFAFTAGMTLIDSLDGVLMLAAYGWASIEPGRKLFYNINITFISVVIALGIGIYQAVYVVHQVIH